MKVDTSNPPTQLKETEEQEYSYRDVEENPNYGSDIGNGERKLAKDYILKNALKLISELIDPETGKKRDADNEEKLHQLYETLVKAGFAEEQIDSYIKIIHEGTDEERKQFYDTFKAALNVTPAKTVAKTTQEVPQKVNGKDVKDISMEDLGKAMTEDNKHTKEEKRNLYLNPLRNQKIPNEIEGCGGKSFGEVADNMACELKDIANGDSKANNIKDKMKEFLGNIDKIAEKYPEVQRKTIKEQMQFLLMNSVVDIASKEGEFPDGKNRLKFLEGIGKTITDDDSGLDFATRENLHKSYLMGTCLAENGHKLFNPNKANEDKNEGAALAIYNNAKNGNYKDLEGELLFRNGGTEQNKKDIMGDVWRTDLHHSDRHAFNMLSHGQDAIEKFGERRTIGDNIHQEDADDCWFLSSINAIGNTKAGQDILEKSIEKQVDPDTGKITYFIRFPRTPNEVYVVSDDDDANEEAKKAQETRGGNDKYIPAGKTLKTGGKEQMVTGEDNMKALELAAAEYNLKHPDWHATGKDNVEKGKVLAGGGDEGYELFGLKPVGLGSTPWVPDEKLDKNSEEYKNQVAEYEKRDEYKAQLKEKFIDYVKQNNPNIHATFAAGGQGRGNMAATNTEIFDDGHTNAHAFAITKVDLEKGEITYENPRNMDKPVTVKIDDFFKLDGLGITIANIPNEKK